MAILVKKEGHHFRAAALLGVSCLGLLAAPGHAQDAARAGMREDVGDIVVTARRREERLQSVPVSVTVATPQILKEQRIVAAQDLQNLAPSLTVTSRVSQQQSSGFNIRGKDLDLALWGRNITDKL